jgi:phosphoribosylformylglycinamidine synthase
LGLVPSIERATTSDAKRAGNVLVLIGETTGELGGSIYGSMSGKNAGAIPRVSLTRGPGTAKAVAAIVGQGLAASAHDCSEGGLLVALAEMLMGSASDEAALGLDVGVSGTLALEALAFAESPSRYVLEIMPGDLSRVRECVRHHAPAGDEIPVTPLGTLTGTGRLVWKDARVDVAVRELVEAWRGPLDW